MSYSYLNNINIKRKYFSRWDQSVEHYQDNLILENMIVRAITNYSKKYDAIYICETFVEINHIKADNTVAAQIDLKYVRNLRKIDFEKLGSEIEKYIMVKLKKERLDAVSVKLKAINNPLVNAKYVCYMISKEMARRINYKRLQKIGKLVLESGGKGCIIAIQGRINGHEIARKDLLIMGKINRNTFENNVQFEKYTHAGKSGSVGIKVWINSGKIINKEYS